MGNRIRPLLLAPASLALAACERESTTPSAPLASVEEPPFELPRPNVIMEADPAPPFTYWAPEGSTIRNHDNPGLWVAHLDGRQVIYFGDSCRASEWQRYVGQSLSSLPPPPVGMTVRSYCATCAKTDDLRSDRINVVFDEGSRTIIEAGCH